MCLNHPRHRGAGVHVDKPSGATSELTVADCVIGWTPELQLGARHDLAATAQEADERVGEVRASAAVLRFPIASKIPPLL